MRAPREQQGKDQGRRCCSEKWWELWPRAPDPNCDHRVKGTDAAKPQSSKEGGRKQDPA